MALNFDFRRILNKMEKVVGVVIITCLIGSSYQQTQGPEYQKLFDTSVSECAKENNVDKGITSNIWSDPSFPVNNEDLQCFYFCLNTKLGVTNAEGVLSEDQLKQIVAHYGKATEVDQIVSECKNVESTQGDLCEYGYLLIKCIAEFQLS